MSFGLLENLTYGNIYTGLVLNGISVGLVLFILGLYFGVFLKECMFYFSELFNILILGIFSSYVTAAILWLIFGSPDTGTSVIGASVVAFPTLILTLDMLNQRENKID